MFVHSTRRLLLVAFKRISVNRVRITAPMIDGEVELIGFWNRLTAPNK